jgi:hypothetical protein
MQLDVLGPDRIAPHWMRLLIPHRFFVGDAFEVMAMILGGAGWHPVGADALFGRCDGLLHGPAWVHSGTDARNDGSFLPLCRLANTGYTLLRADKAPHRPERVVVGRTTGGLLNSTLHLTQHEAVDGGWFHTDYEHAPIGSAHAALAAQRKALALGAKAVTQIG